MSDSIESGCGLAEVGGPRWTRAEIALLRQAARGRWSIPDAVKEEAVYQLARILTAPETSDREKLSAARTLALLDRLDQAEERQELERTRVEVWIRRRRPYQDEAPIHEGAAAAALRAAAEYMAALEGETLDSWEGREPPSQEPPE
jgi:hypothetical protein